MTMAKGERILTAVAVAATIAIIAVFIWVILESHSGRMPYDSFVLYSVALSGMLTFVVLIYAVIMVRPLESTTKRYEDYAEERKRKGERSRICHLLYYATHHSREADRPMVGQYGSRIHEDPQ